MNLDLYSLKQQYRKVRQRQKQAHVIITGMLLLQVCYYYRYVIITGNTSTCYCDLYSLKQEYRKVRQRQKQAHVIITGKDRWQEQVKQVVVTVTCTHHTGK